jgi:hypothetical protein
MIRIYHLNFENKKFIHNLKMICTMHSTRAQLSLIYGLSLYYMGCSMYNSLYRLLEKVDINSAIEKCYPFFSFRVMKGSLKSRPCYYFFPAYCMHQRKFLFTENWFFYLFFNKTLYNLKYLISKLKY